MPTTIYRLKHLPTGKFYKPAGGYAWRKCHLSPNGKIYVGRKPALPTSLIVQAGRGYVNSPEDDWEVHKYVLGD